MKTGAIIQARMGSTRLPGKIMEKILGKSIIELIVGRLRQTKRIDAIVLATSTDPRNDVAAREAEKLGIGCFRGSEENVLDRIFQARKKFGLDVVVRITGDCPLIDPETIDKGIEIFQKNKVDIASNTLERTFPHGLDFEVFSADALERAWTDEKNRLGGDFMKVFVNPTARMKESGKFKHLDILNDKDLSRIRITLDYSEDLELIKKVYGRLYPRNPNFGLREVEELFEQEPQLLEINKAHNPLI